MQDRQKELLQSHVERLRKANDDLKGRLTSLNKENADILKSLTRSDALLNALPAGLVLIQDGRVLRTNDSILQYLSCKPEDIIGIDFTDLIHPDERGQIAKIHKMWESGRMSPDQYEARLAPSSGTPVFYEIRCRRIRFQNRTAFLLTATRIKERLEQEKQKVKKEKTDALRTMAIGVKDRFRPFAENILETIMECRMLDHSGSKRLEGIFKKLEETSVKALKTAEELDIIAGSRKEKQPPVIFNLNEAVKAAVQSTEKKCMELAEAKGINITLKSYMRSASLIEGDLKNITKAISRIITNAMEAMPEGGDVYITTEDNNGDSHVYVQDNGKGIPDMFKERVFDPFFSTKKGSTGLGLSISRSIIEKHRGDIEFTSIEGEGAIFHIRLPVTGQKPVSKSKSLRKKITDARIMIIQENDVAREVLSHTLKTRGCRIVKASNTAEVLVKLRNRHFDMLVVDEDALNMKKDALIKKARKISPGLPIALIASANAGSGIENHQGIQADLSITKPVDVNSTVKRISEILSAKKQI